VQGRGWKQVLQHASSRDATSSRGRHAAIIRGIWTCSSTGGSAHAGLRCASAGFSHRTCITSKAAGAGQGRTLCRAALCIRRACSLGPGSSPASVAQPRTRGWPRGSGHSLAHRNPLPVHAPQMAQGTLSAPRAAHASLRAQGMARSSGCLRLPPCS